MTPSELIDLIIERAPKLRAAGVRYLALPDAICVRIDPPDPEVQQLPIGFDDPPPEPADPLDDPITYGLDRVPGFEIPNDE
jgi:hypothetical protein